MSSKLFLVSLFCFLFASAFSKTNEISIDLQFVDLFERLNLTANVTQEAFYDGRFDAILAFGKSVYTARLGVGNPPQPVDFLFNWVGGMISPGVGDLSFLLTPNAFGPSVNVTSTNSFNASASNTFISHSDATFQTKIQPSTFLNISVKGFYGEDNIMFRNIEKSNNINVRERSLAQIEQMQDSKLFSQLSVGGILSMSKQSEFMAKIINDDPNDDQSKPKRAMLIYGKQYGKLVIDTARDLWNKLCQNRPLYYHLESDFGNETGPIMDAFRVKIQGLNMKGEGTNMEYDDNIARRALVNPNAMFIQGPRRTVAKLAMMAKAKKQTIGRHQLYMIECNQQYGPLAFKLRLDISLEKENLKIKLPRNLLPHGQCLWAIQELDDTFDGNDANAPWIFGGPFFQQKHCLVIDPQIKSIAFPKYVGDDKL